MGKAALKRLPNWRTGFHQTLDAIRRKPFAWGEHDCALGLAAPCVEAITGVDLGAEWRGRYATAGEALAALRAAGHNRIDSLLSDLFQEVPVSFAQVGDLVTLPGDAEGLSIGVVIGRHIASLRADGMATVPLKTGLKAFRVAE